MVFSHSYLIIPFLLVFVPYVATLKFHMSNIIVTEGDCYITSDGIQLTPNEIGSDQYQKSGRASYIKPLHLWDNKSGELASFSTNFTFVIDSDGESIYGDGLTFFLAPNYSDITRGGAMGLPINPTTIVATSKFVAVEFDTFWNDGWDPIVWDPVSGTNTSMGDHVGISISSLTSVRSQKWLSDIPGGAVCQAYITYDSVTHKLSVSFTGFQNTAVVRQDGLSYKIDLRKELPEWVIFGFSAATGGAIQKNTVRSWTFDSSNLKTHK